MLCCMCILQELNFKIVALKSGRPNSLGGVGGCMIK